MGEKEPKKNLAGELTISFLMPMLVGKCLIIYFGLQYTEYPDRGYGYGLVASMAFTVCMIGRFLWRNRNYED